MKAFRTLEDMVVTTAAGVRPPERTTVSKSAEKYRYVVNPGVYRGKYLNSMTPYMVEPQDLLTSAAHTAMIFVGPAQTGKTDILLNWITHSVICDPADMICYNMTQISARDFYVRRLQRFYEQNKDVDSRILPGKHSRTMTITRFATMLFSMSWPTITEMSGRPVPRLWLTDYDRMPESIDGEGSPFDLARKRATSFRWRGMCVAESSPGWEVDNPRWSARTPHEAPPTKGILSLYNRGDRRRWYWKCPRCYGTFEPDFTLLKWPETEDFMAAAEETVLVCPHCQLGLKHDGDEKEGYPGKYDLNLGGRWIKDGQRWEGERVEGNYHRSDIGSFWLKGPAAAFVDWKTLVLNYLNAYKEFVDSGSQEALKTTVNTDQGLPYLPRGSEINRLPEDLKNRAVDLPKQEVPEGVRYLITTIDVQKSRFVVQVHGFGRDGDVWIVDRYDVRYSKRTAEDAPDQFLWISPGSYPEDWYLLIKAVLTKDYPLSDGSGRRMKIKMIGCDSGGREGVTKNAYDFYRVLRDGVERDKEEPEGWVEGLHTRFRLLKGSPVLSIPTVQLSYPDSERKDRKAGARGEVPVLMLNSNALKDQLNVMLDRREPGGGKITFPNWLKMEFYNELTVETRTRKGWENPKFLRNESWDLLCYALGTARDRNVRSELIDWDNPPDWAETWDRNDMIYLPDSAGKSPFELKKKRDYDLTSLAATLL